MTAKIDGTNGLLQQYDYQVLTTAFSYTFAAGTTVLVINPAGTLATGTITMPAAPADGMTITVESTQQVTALTMSGNGGTVVGPAIQLIPNQPLSWVYRLANTTWYPLFGGAGRASALVSGTAVASTSGTSIDFTSIPSWVKRITVLFSGVSTNNTSSWLMQIGSGSIVTTGYTSGTLATQSAAVSSAAATSTSGFIILNANAAVYLYTGTVQLFNISGNTWIASGVLASTSGDRSNISGGTLTLSGSLDRLRITSVTPDTFDAGSINIFYE